MRVPFHEEIGKAPVASRELSAGGPARPLETAAEGTAG